jgi:hypothetical protein
MLRLRKDMARLDIEARTLTTLPSFVITSITSAGFAASNSHEKGARAAARDRCQVHYCTIIQAYVPEPQHTSDQVCESDYVGL